jgi:hypothetical protein
MSRNREVAAAKAFYAFKTQRRAPRTITLDGYRASHRSVGELWAKIESRGLSVFTRVDSSTTIVQDHRAVADGGSKVFPGDLAAGHACRFGLVTDDL